jgi:hypothetical protein
MDLQTEKYIKILLTDSDCVIDWRCVDVVDDIDCFYDVTVPISMYWSMGWINKWMNV